MGNVTIAVRDGVAYVVDKSHSDIEVKIINYDILDMNNDVIIDEYGNKCSISIE